MAKTFLGQAGLPGALCLALACSGKTTDDELGSGGSGAAEGGSGGSTENGTGGAGTSTGGDADDCAWSKAPEVTCEEFEGSPSGTLILGARQAEECRTFDWIEGTLALRGIDFDADQARGAGGGSSNACPASDVLFPEGITYGGGCGPFPFLLCDGPPDRTGERCCYPVLEATFSGCCG